VTVAALIPQITFSGTVSGTLGPFSLIKSGTPIHFATNSEIKVYRYDTTTDTTPELLVEGTDYDLTGGPDAGSLMLTSPQTGLLSAERLFVYRENAVTQDLDLSYGGSFSGPNIEARFDRTTRQIQDLRREVQSSIRLANLSADDIPRTLPLEKAIDRLVYISGTAADPVVSTVPLPGESSLSASDLADVNTVAADLNGADTIGEVAAWLAGGGGTGGGGGMVVVASYTAATAIDVSGYSNGQAIFIRGRTSQNDGGGGIWCWNTADLSSEVTADPEAARYLPPSSDDTGASGAFVKQTGGNTVFNVLEYGATGDGTTDDTDAVNAAIAAIPTTGNTPGGVLYFPRGHYRLDQIDDIPDYTTVMGDGPTSTRLDFQDQASGNGLSTAGTSYFVVFKDFLLQSAYAHGIHADNMSQGRFENVFVRWCGTDGIYIDNSSYQITLENVRTDSNDGMGLNIEGFVTSIFCQNVFARLNGSHGFRINDAVYTRLANCSSDQNTGNGYIASNVTCLTLAGCSAEKNTKSAIKFAASDAIAANCLNGASGEYGYVREVTIDTFFSFHNAQETGTTTASFIACDSDDSREIDVLLVNCRDEVDV
jgi:hypothetical protein